MPAFIRQGGGRVLATSSVTGPRVAYPGLAHYAASKAGVNGFIRAAALELAKHRITVNGVEPGMIRTPAMDNLGDERTERRASNGRFRSGGWANRRISQRRCCFWLPMRLRTSQGKPSSSMAARPCRSRLPRSSKARLQMVECQCRHIDDRGAAVGDERGASHNRCSRRRQRTRIARRSLGECRAA